MTRGQDGTVRLPFGNMRFRVEIDGISGGGAFEVVFPEARIAGRGRNGRRVLYGPLIPRWRRGRSRCACSSDRQR
jgi:hypothetical protein